MTTGVALYGPPAAGKDTITAALSALDPCFELVPLLKAGPGKTNTYRMTTREQIDGRPLVWRFERYGAVYALAFDDLTAAFRASCPVVHVGTPARLAALMDSAGDWLPVELWCPRPVAVERLRRRNPDDVTDRLAVWDSTPRLPLPLRIDTSEIRPELAAEMIRARLTTSAVRKSAAEEGGPPL